MLFLIVMNPRALGESEADGRLRPRPELAGGKGGGGKKKNLPLGEFGSDESRKKPLPDIGRRLFYVVLCGRRVEWEDVERRMDVRMGGDAVCRVRH